MDRIRHGAVRMVNVFIPGIEQRQIGRRFGESASFIDVGSDNLGGPPGRTGSRRGIGVRLGRQDGFRRDRRLFPDRI